MGSVDVRFHDALHEFRREKTLQLFGRRHLHNWGPGTVMGDTTLKRIIDCSRAYKLGSMEALVRETKWTRAGEYGNDILQLVVE